MKVSKKAVNILGVALVYTVTSSFVALMPQDLIATKSYFNASGHVNAAINTLKSDKIIYVDAESFDAKKWIQTGATNIYIINARDDGKPIVVYFEIIGNLRDLVGGISPIKVYPGDEGEELVMPIRDISMFELRDNTFYGTIKVRAFNDYINDFEIEIPEVEGNDILSMRRGQWPYGGGDASIMSMRTDGAMAIDILVKYNINTYEDMAKFINDFEILEEKFNDLQKSYDALLAEKEELIKKKEELMRNNEALSHDKEQLLGEIDRIENEKDQLAQDYESLSKDVERLRNHTCPSPSTGGSPIPAQPPAPAEPIPTDPVPTDPVPTDPVPTDPVPGDPTPEEPTPTDPAPTEPAPGDPEPAEPPTPSEPAPADPAPGDPAPAEPEPADPDNEDDDGGSQPGNADIIDNGSKDDDDAGEVMPEDDGNDNVPPGDSGAQAGEDNVSSAIKDMADKLKNYI
ncbi:hypothetical protein [Lutispora saccharofermentans]|uniref:Uncharacterized protein n=1 Tax=Lutispora saccharofermentans TaxID=3024236 RepID=A0ABT1NEP3_9FIRM|nr:hypothetical protein [Lutispora saccharofermentans]MCQ1528648.1 hypothetical protein [Lutispora saccharofermentans]